MKAKAKKKDLSNHWRTADGGVTKIGVDVSRERSRDNRWLKTRKKKNQARSCFLSFLLTF